MSTGAHFAPVFWGILFFSAENRRERAEGV